MKDNNDDNSSGSVRGTTTTTTINSSFDKSTTLHVPATVPPTTCPSPLQQFLFVAVEQLRGANIGTSLRCAVAFRADAFVLVGSSKYSTHGAHGAQGHIPILHFFHWDDFRVFVKELNINCEVCGLHSSTCTGEGKGKGKEGSSGGSSSSSSGMEVAEVYDFPQAAVALLLPDKKSGQLSPQQLQLTETHLQTRFAHCPNSAIAGSVHLDVKLSLCLQRYAVLHHSSCKEVRITEEEKFEIQHLPVAEENQTVVLQLFADFKRKAKAEAMANPVICEGGCDNSNLFSNGDDFDY